MTDSVLAFSSSNAVALLCLGGAAILALCALGARAAKARPGAPPEALDVEEWIGAEGHLHSEAQAFVAALQDEACALAQAVGPQVA